MIRKGGGNLISKGGVVGMNISEVITNEIKEKIENYDFIVIPRDKNKDFKRMYRLNNSKIRQRHHIRTFPYA